MSKDEGVQGGRERKGERRKNVSKGEVNEKAKEETSERSKRSMK